MDAVIRFAQVADAQAADAQAADARAADARVVDITGGAPEMCPEFRRFVVALFAQGLAVMWAWARHDVAQSRTIGAMCRR